MYAKTFKSVEKQTGSSLIEVLIATALVGIMLHGAATLTTRAAATSTDQQLITIAVEQMRTHLLDPGICTTPPTINIPDGTTNGMNIVATVQGCDTTTVSIDNVTLNNVPSPLRLSVTSPLFGGQVVVGGTWDYTQ